MDYIAITHNEPNSDFGVSFPDFPGCITAGRTLDEAKDMAAEALRGHIEVMYETGEPVPDPSTLDEVVSNPEFRDGVAFIVSVEEPGKTLRVNITLTRRNHTRLTSMRARRG
jgi:predicted RNase H-like HicB family nuclease